MMALEHEEAARQARLEVTVVEPEEEPFTLEATEHPLLDGDHAEYQHAPETAGLDYAQELSDEEATPVAKKSAKKPE
jgi:hypothetical protein